MIWIFFVLFIVLFLSLALLIQKFIFNRYIRQLFSNSPMVSSIKFSYTQIENLPEPVKKYFKLVLKEGQPYISYVRLKHNGYFRTKPNGKWVQIKGQEYFTAYIPGFIWKGSTKLFHALDMFIAGKGKLFVYLFRIIRILKSEGEETDRGELLRWLAEAVVFPTALLPNDYILWRPINQTSSRLILSYNDFQLECQVFFKDTGEIYQIESNRFYMNDKKLHKWIGYFSGYKRYNDILVPTVLEVSWDLPEGIFNYVRFNITKLEFDKPYCY
ncbi:MAG: DUF6544 family protein [Ignavibacteria bacterium]